MLVSCALAGCLFESTDIAGTNDETTTSLQTLADNVRQLPGMGVSPGASRLAGRISNPPAGLHWGFGHFLDHDTWSAWRLIGKTACMPLESDPHFCRMQVWSHENDALGFTESEGSYSTESDSDSQVRSLRMEKWSYRYLNRSRFSWSATQTFTADAMIVRLDFPSEGLHVDYRGDWIGEHGFLQALIAGLPLLRNDGRTVGFLSIDTAVEWETGNPPLRWFDLERREIIPRALPFQPNVHDTLGLRVLSLRRDSSAGEIVLEGRFHLPASYGLVPDQVLVYAGSDSAYLDLVSALVRPAPDGRFTLHLPQGPGELPESGWMRLAYSLAEPGNSASRPGRFISTSILRIP